MTAARFAVAAIEFKTAAIEIKRADVVAAVVAQLLDAPHDAVGVEAARARADAQRQWPIVAVDTLGRLGVEQAVKEEEGQVVDHLPAEILERAQHRRLARARHAGDEQDLLGLALGHAGGFAR